MIAQAPPPPPPPMIPLIGKFSQLKIIRAKNFRVIKFSQFRSIREIFLTVDDCNMDKCLESSWRLVYYQVSGERGIPGCSVQSDIYLGECGRARASLFTDHRRVILFFAC